MDTGSPFLPGHFEYTTGKTKLLRMHLAPFLLIPETFSVMALAFDSSISFFSDILPRLRHHSSRDPRMCCRTIPSIPGSRVNYPIKSTKPFPVRHRSATNDEYRAPRRDKSAPQKNSARCFFQAIRRSTQGGRHQKRRVAGQAGPPKIDNDKGRRPRGGEVDMLERGMVLGPVDGPMQRRVLKPASKRTTSQHRRMKFPCGWAAVDDCQRVTGFRFAGSSGSAHSACRDGHRLHEGVMFPEHSCWKVDRVILML